jgi:hypothetical protein
MYETKFFLRENLTQILPQLFVDNRYNKESKEQHPIFSCL